MSDGIFAPGFLRSFNNAKTPASEIRDLPLNEVLVDDQVRKNFRDEDISALAQSIKKIGCIEPIVVWGPDITRGRKYHLICGELRYRAHALLGKATIRAVITSKPQSDEDLKILQLAENYNRSSLSPFEMADALAVLRKSMDINDLMAVFTLKSSSIYAYLQITELDARERSVLKDQSLASLLKYCKLKKTRPQAAQALLNRLEGEEQPENRGRRTDAEIRAARLKKYQGCLTEIKKSDEVLYGSIQEELKTTGETAQDLILRALRLLLNKDLAAKRQGGADQKL